MKMQNIAHNDNLIRSSLIKEAVANHFEVTVEALERGCRQRIFTLPRHIAVYFCSVHTQLSLTAIGAEFGGRDHSTVIYSRQVVEDCMDVDPAYRALVAKLDEIVCALF